MTGSSRPEAKLLEVADLAIGHKNGIRLVEAMNFTINRGETVGLVGESGCGKSLTALAVMGLLDENLRVASGKIILDGMDLVGLTDAKMRKLRGSRIAMIFQEPLTSLNPVMTIGQQIIETLLAHRNLSRNDATKRAIELMEMVRIPDAASRFHDYPHRLSGGMRQRVVIAIALSCNPSLIIADEPTTALDVTVQAQILNLLKTLQQESNLGLLFITHDLGVVRQITDRVAVMYAGSVVEEGITSEVLDNPQHPYTDDLLKARPQGSYMETGQKLADIKGTVPDPEARMHGCLFEPRCRNAQPDCKQSRPDLTRQGTEHVVRCYHPVGEPA